MNEHATQVLIVDAEQLPGCRASYGVFTELSLAMDHTQQSLLMVEMEDGPGQPLVEWVHRWPNRIEALLYTPEPDQHINDLCPHVLSTLWLVPVDPDALRCRTNVTASFAPPMPETRGPKPEAPKGGR